MARATGLPAQHPIQILDFPRLDGGLNLSEVGERLKPNESPEMENLWWEDGALQSRPGQQSVETRTNSGVTPGAGYAVTETPFYGSYFFHLGARIYRWDGSTDEAGREVLYQIAADVPMNAGTFFRFGDFLFYKNKGGFLRIEYRSRTNAFRVTNVAEEAYVPTILINADPETGTGDLYQPENRLSARKTVTYTPSTYSKRQTAGQTGNGTARVFYVGSTAAKGLHTVSAVYVGGVEQPPTEWEINPRTGYLTFAAAPPNGARIVFTLAMNRDVYKLPVKEIDSVESVTVDGVKLRQGRDYTVDATAGKLTFTHAPAVKDPPAQNSVVITYAKANLDPSGKPAAYNAVMDCTSAAVYGAGTQLCIVLAGCPAQPNAVFWSGNNDSGLDPSYWPVENYNLLGDTEDPITGFGCQYSDLLVFKAHSIGKLNFSGEELNGRAIISLNYARVNNKIGCDLPGSIQLIQNNLVFASTSGGVYQVASSSPAYENNVLPISGKVDGSDQRPGLLSDLLHTERGGAVGSRFSSGLNNARTAQVCSLDDGKRYWLYVNGHVWLWDYSLSSWENPVWFYFTGFANVAAWFAVNGKAYHLDRAGKLTRMARVFDDYGAAFRRVYKFPVQLFGRYDRLKNVQTVIIALREENPGVTSLTYLTDYEQRADLTPLTVPGSASISPRDLTFRDLSVQSTAAVFRRRPMCSHVRHFAMRLENANAGEDLAILYAQIQYRLLGRDR